MDLRNKHIYRFEQALGFFVKEPWNTVRYHGVARLSREISRQISVAEGGRPPVVFFNASARLRGMSLNAAFALLASWAVRFTGKRVVHFVCRAGLRPCLLGTRSDDPNGPPPCLGCIAQSRRLYAGAEIRWFTGKRVEKFPTNIGMLNVEELKDVKMFGLPLGELVLPSVRWILRRHNLLDNPPTRELFRSYIESARQVARDFTRLVDEVRPCTVVVFNGMFYPEAVVRRVAQEKGLRVISHEVGVAPLSAFFTEKEATAYPVDLPDSFILTPRQDRELDHYFAQRVGGRFTMAGIQFWPTMTPLGGEVRERLSSFKRLVPVFTNVVFDTCQAHAHTVFSDMFDWLDHVWQIIPEYPETLFVIRAHPDEYRPGKRSRETVADWVASRSPSASSNWVFIDADDSTSSYTLIESAHMVLVYNSTIGLEAAMMGKAVVCGGKARYTPYDTVYQPESRSAFRDLIRRLLGSESEDLSGPFQVNARRFMYYLLFCSSLPLADYLLEDPGQPGFVQMKEVSLEQLGQSRSLALEAIVQGITNGKGFILGG